MAIETLSRMLGIPTTAHSSITTPNDENTRQQAQWYKTASLAATVAFAYFALTSALAIAPLTACFWAASAVLSHASFKFFAAIEVSDSVTNHIQIQDLKNWTKDNLVGRSIVDFFYSA